MTYYKTLIIYIYRYISSLLLFFFCISTNLFQSIMSVLLFTYFTYCSLQLKCKLRKIISISNVVYRPVSLRYYNYCIFLAKRSKVHFKLFSKKINFATPYFLLSFSFLKKIMIFVFTNESL